MVIMLLGTMLAVGATVGSPLQVEPPAIRGEKGSRMVRRKIWPFLAQS